MKVYVAYVVSGVAEFFDRVTVSCGVLDMNCSVSVLTAHMTEALRQLQQRAGMTRSLS